MDAGSNCPRLSLRNGHGMIQLASLKTQLPAKAVTPNDLFPRQGHIWFAGSTKIDLTYQKSGKAEERYPQSSLRCASFWTDNEKRLTRSRLKTFSASLFRKLLITPETIMQHAINAKRYYPDTTNQKDS